MELNVQIKQAGRRENKIVTAKLLLKQAPRTAGELIASAVKATYSAHYEKANEIEAFENGDLSQVIIYTLDELKQKAAGGKIDFGFLKNDKKVSEKKAVETALQAFEDGLVAVFVDGTRYKNTDDTLELTGNETVTFVKLTMLTGRLW
ncbi:MAG: hypothetical protein IJ362_06740 [Oscillospiraceae bacterium]|nr:hypothetical protein [Oscillospiraceae bacterium]